MKKNLPLLGLLLASGVAVADTHQYELDLAAMTFDEYDDEMVGLRGSYYFEKVDNSNVPWAEAAFMGRNSNVSALHADGDGSLSIAGIRGVYDARATGIYGEYFGPEAQDLYARVGVSYVDGDLGVSYWDVGSNHGFYKTIFDAEVGYFFQQDWLVSIATQHDTDGDSYPVVLKTKYVGKIDDSQSFNIEASIDDRSEELELSGDYYFTPQASIGAILSTDSDFDFGVRGQYFFNSKIAARLEVTSEYDDESYFFGLIARF